MDTEAILAALRRKHEAAASTEDAAEPAEKPVKKVAKKSTPAKKG